jgi:hypothetical protein
VLGIHRALIATADREIVGSRVQVRTASLLVAVALVTAATAAADARVARTGASATSPPNSSFVGSQTSSSSSSQQSDAPQRDDGGGQDDGIGAGSSSFGSGSGSIGFAGVSVPSAGPGGARSGLDVASVRRLQTELARLGYFHHVVTGFYGPITTAAVKRFQRVAGLRPDGIWGPLSAAALAQRLG